MVVKARITWGLAEEKGRTWPLGDSFLEFQGESHSEVWQAELTRGFWVLGVAASGWVAAAAAVAAANTRRGSHPP